MQLPVWELGLLILIPTAVAFGARWPLQKRYVTSVRPTSQSIRQFRLDLILFTAASLVTALLLFFIHGFPLIQSGLKLVLGIFTVGLFAGLDLALARERVVIGAAQKGAASFSPPSRLVPMTRKFTLIATLILMLVTAIILLVIIRDVNWLTEQELTMDTLDMVSRSVLIEVLFVMGFLLIMVVNLIFSYARNLTILFAMETEVLEKVSRGDLTSRVPVTTADEMGVIAGHTNAMITSLREKVRMREGLLIAQEVQQNFLPKFPPAIPGVEIDGVSIFSDETGGDFFDFIPCEGVACGELAVVVGDVSGHGIGAALLMAAARAVIRQNAASMDIPSETMAQTNSHLARDLDGTGRFLTLFFLTLNPGRERATWVNAGHQPPLLYDPEKDVFHSLRGEDIPLGVQEKWLFHEHVIDYPKKGQVLLMGTDGVWEARNKNGDMYGTERVKRYLRDHYTESATEIMQGLCEAVLDFANDNEQEDDLTLVVVKGV